MLNDATGFKHAYVTTGKTDLRKGQDSLLMIIKNEFHLDPFEDGNIFLFCGSRGHIIKAIVFEGDGFTLLTKRLLNGHFQWPRDSREVLDITEEQYRDLIQRKQVKYLMDNYPLP